MDIKDIKKIIELMKANELSEFELEQEGFRIAIKRRNGNEQQVVLSSPGSAPVVVPSSSVGTQPSNASAAEGAGEEGGSTISPRAAAPHLVEILSPMVGTFYRSSSPESDPFVTVGDEVDEDTVVCIIEAMKVMNEIKAETRGIIREIAVENANPVEFGEPLFLVEPL